MDRLARPSARRVRQPAQAPEPTLSPAPQERGPAGQPADRLRRRPRFEPRNLAFADGLDGWLFAGNFSEHASESHWHDYACTAENGSVVLSSAVPEPAGFAVLGQELFSDDYRGAVITFRGEFRTADAPGRAGLFLRVNEGQPIRDQSRTAPSSPIRTTTSSRSRPAAAGPGTRSARGSRTTPTRSCSASSWRAPARSRSATPSWPSSSHDRGGSCQEAAEGRDPLPWLVDVGHVPGAGKDDGPGGGNQGSGLLGQGGGKGHVLPAVQQQYG